MIARATARRLALNGRRVFSDFPQLSRAFLISLALSLAGISAASAADCAQFRAYYASSTGAVDHAEGYFDENDGDAAVAMIRVAVHDYDMSERHGTAEACLSRSAVAWHTAFFVHLDRLYSHWLYSTDAKGGYSKFLKSRLADYQIFLRDVSQYPRAQARVAADIAAMKRDIAKNVADEKKYGF